MWATEMRPFNGSTSTGLAGSRGRSRPVKDNSNYVPQNAVGNARVPEPIGVAGGRKRGLLIGTGPERAVVSGAGSRDDTRTQGHSPSTIFNCLYVTCTNKSD